MGCQMLMAAGSPDLDRCKEELAEVLLHLGSPTFSGLVLSWAAWGAAGAPGTGSGCAFQYLPVCSAQNATLPSACVAQQERAVVDCRGLCPCGTEEGLPTFCPAVYFPVCGANGQTYDSSCRARFQDIPIVHAGACTTGISFVAACPDIYLPICGSDGVTYGNDCLTRGAGAARACDGECPCAHPAAEECPPEEGPVCGLDDVSYTCAAAAKRVGIACSGECPCQDPVEQLLTEGGYLIVPDQPAMEDAMNATGVEGDSAAAHALWLRRAALLASGLEEAQAGSSSLTLGHDLGGGRVLLEEWPDGSIRNVTGTGGGGKVLDSARVCGVTVLMVDEVPYVLD